MSLLQAFFRHTRSYLPKLVPVLRMVPRNLPSFFLCMFGKMPFLYIRQAFGTNAPWISISMHESGQF
jgi:hypothetical protein